MLQKKIYFSKEIGFVYGDIIFYIFWNRLNDYQFTYVSIEGTNLIMNQTNILII